MLTRYHFTTLWLHESLGDQTAVPFAVLVESKRYVYCIGLYLEGDETVTGQVLRNFPAILQERVSHAASTVGGTGLALEVLRREFAWNIRAESISWRLSFAAIETFAHKLFVERVENWLPTLPEERKIAANPLNIFAFESAFAAA